MDSSFDYHWRKTGIAASSPGRRRPNPNLAKTDFPGDGAKPTFNAYETRCRYLSQDLQLSNTSDMALNGLPGPALRMSRIGMSRDVDRKQP